MASIDVSMGEAIKRARMTRGLSQRQLAERMGGNRAYVSRLERGNRSPTLRTLDVVAQAFQLEPWRLLRMASRLAGDTAERPDSDAEIQQRAAALLKAHGYKDGGYVPVAKVLQMICDVAMARRKKVK